MQTDILNVAPNVGPLRIGMLTPSSNTVVEPYTTKLLAPLFPDVSVHFARFRVTQIALNNSANSQFSLPPVLEAARLLADARCDVIAWNGTSASWLGFETDEAMCAAISKETGITATSAILGLNKLLRQFNVRRLGLVTPYTADVQARIMKNYAAFGIDTVSERHSDLSENFSFATVPEGTIGDMCLDVSRAEPDAIAIVCTNARGALIAPALEDQLKIPVLDSVSFTLWACLDACDYPKSHLSPFGSMFQQ
jgi:maleate isomerase